MSCGKICVNKDTLQLTEPKCSILCQRNPI